MHVFRYDSFDKKAFKARLESINDANWIKSSPNRKQLEDESDVCVPKGIEKKPRNLFSPVSNTRRVVNIQWESVFSREVH